MSTPTTGSVPPSRVSVQPGSFQVNRPQNPDDVVELIKQNNIEIVDLRFTDLPGLWQHFSVTLPEVNASLFSDGIGFDGSSIRGFQEIQESDMLLKPDPATAFI
jgi:glutamine synthetase